MTRCGKSIGLLLALAAVFVVIRLRVGSAAEAVWLIFPFGVFAGSWLGVITPPRLGAKNRWSRWGSVFLLVAFPCGFYETLVVLTGSIWSWKEFLIALFFFGLSFEFALLYLFQAADAVHERLSHGLSPLRAGLVWIAGRVALYSVLIPWMFVIFAVHRPKLLPAPLSGFRAAEMESVTFTSRDGRTHLNGLFLKPSQKSRRGTVIVCHGVGANHADLEVIHRLLFDLGYQVFAFDFRGHGASDGHTVTYGWNEKDDVLGAYDWCLSQTDVSDKPLYALGASMGGAILVQALPQMPQVRAVILDSAFADLTAMAEYQFRFFPHWSRPVFVQIARGFAWIETGVDITRIKPSETISHIEIPILVIHGTADRIVPPENAQKLAAAGRHIKIHLESECPHIGMAMLNPVGYSRLIDAQFRAAATEPNRNSCWTLF